MAKENKTEVAAIDVAAILSKTEALTDADKDGIKGYIGDLVAEKAAIRSELDTLADLNSRMTEEIEALKKTSAGVQKENVKLVSELTALKDSNAELAEELEALKIADDLGSESVQVTVKKGVWTYKGRKYSFKEGITHVFIQGKKVAVEEALKNEAYLASLAEGKAILIKMVD